MTDEGKEIPLEREDVRAALSEMKTYVDVTEEDLVRIYEIALRHARQRLAAKIPVRQVMTKQVVAVGSDTDLEKAVRLLSEHKISGMPVVDDGGRVVGIISEADLLQLTGIKKHHTFRDIIRNLLGEAERVNVTVSNGVEAVMSAPALTIGPDEDIRKAALLLDERRIKRLPVVDGEGRLLGIVSRGDIVRAIGMKVAPVTGDNEMSA